ncbi:beta-galactosidase [Neorhizobium sp. IRAMC:178]|uniref:beta-galactosidase n=1 Tax=Neorhizobium tunisiense TaxID=3144793 RepID=UPI0031F6902B
MLRHDIKFPYGAVYFRKSNPPREDWERDYTTAGEDGLNIFRHWFMWSAIETAPGVYDWEEYDRQMDLAAKNGIKTVIAELIHAVPDWAVRKYADALQVNADGTRLGSYMGVSAATGGFSNNGGGAGALTLNCPEVKEAAGRFLTALATRYKDHPAIYGYDVWNECNYSADVDYSSYAKSAFHTWLEKKYGTLKVLAKAWHRYSYAEWEDVEPPVHMAPYPECIDWLQFKRDNFYDQMQWRIDTIRAVDPKNTIAAHGISGAIPNMAANGCDDWLAASKVEIYGFTWIQARKGSEAWKNWYGVDINRAAARGKPFWHAERQGGPLWLQPQVIGRDKDDGRVAEPEDIRLWSMTSFAGGARGVLNLRWRPLLDGPLFGAFGAYGMDGSRTPRSTMQSDMARWANDPAQAALWEAKPVRGEIGILVIPETQEWDYLLNYDRKEKPYPEAMWGAYRAFLENGVQPDWVHIDDIDAYDRLYFPYPIMFTAEQAKRLAAWVEKGGTLIAEACPGYFGDRGHVGQVQPNMGLDKVFGAREDQVEFMPDLGDRIHFELDGAAVDGGGFLQSYVLTGGTARGNFDDGRLAVVESTYGKGRTLLIGTNPSVAYYKSQGKANGAFFAELLRWSGCAPHATLSNKALFARIHRSEKGSFLWLVNPTRSAQLTEVKLAEGHGRLAPGKAVWPVGHDHGGGMIEVPARDVLILPLE